MTSKGTLEGKRFYVHLVGMQAVILYPALTTPALVDEEGVLTVILAVDHWSVDALEKIRGEKFAPQAPLKLFDVMKFHSQLLLVPWGNGHSEGFTQDDDKDNQEFVRFYNGINTFNNTIFGGPTQCMEAFENGKNTNEKEKPFVRGSYIGPIQGSSVIQVQKEGKTLPFGVLADAAAKMYSEAGYTHLFCLEFGNFTALETVQNQASAMYELVWLYVARPPEDPEHQYENPSDTVLVENFAQNINPFVPGSKEVFLKENVDTRPQKIQRKMKGEPQDLNLFRLRASSAKDTKLEAPSEIDLKEFPWLTQKGGKLLYSRHPVFFKKKITKFAAMSDLHLSSRQMLYKTVKAQVIPFGKDSEDSPFIGKMAHDNFSSVRDLMGQLCEKADALLIAGDIYDHRQNLDPKVCLEEGKVTNTASLWDLFDYLNYKGEPDEAKYYPKHIDGLMMLELILEQYAGAKPRPIFLVTGNHEGYRFPYGISPRFTEKNIKLNSGIPADHNLSIYEAVLLYGPSYHRFITMDNFKYEALEWIFQTFTPWSNFYLSQKDFNLVGLEWGKKEAIGSVVASNLVQVTLPFATNSINTVQKRLVDHAAGYAEKKKNILLSHFTHINYNLNIPFRDEDGEPKKENITINLDAVAEDDCNTGSYKESQHEMADLWEAGKIHYAISGHSHRAGAYAFERPKEDADKGFFEKMADKIPKSVYRAIKTSALSFMGGPHMLPTGGALPKDRVALVSGSAGPMANQNMAGELEKKGMDAPQGLILDIEKNRVDFVRWKNDEKTTSKPRLSVLVANLCHFDGIWPFWRAPTHYHPFDIQIIPEARNPEGRIRFQPERKLLEIFGEWPVGRVKPGFPHTHNDAGGSMFNFL